MNKFMQLLKNEKVEWKTIGEISEVLSGKKGAKYFNIKENGKFPLYSGKVKNNGEFGRIDEYDFDGRYITFTIVGDAGVFFLRNGKFSITDNCGLLYSKNNFVLTEFIGLYLQNFGKKYVKKEATRESLTTGIVKKIKIPIPSLKTQEKIVQILDKLSNLKNELNQKLKIELNSRIKQYEYYRDKLLSEEYLNKITYNLTHDTHTHTHTAKS
ncbi:restriction endonuclease subunit S [Mesomycoplasma lagogenitalium]|uniref:Restriction endonuclease subunit S n=1 Tax=Mesomycoplasma lagogenitalium TaxID=171286 RepID=A0ABY8LSS4_9BACT|nr:restriction endonuclease subunit S [Mesomycoplasma lagogenitalium]WGI36305.1 restriction endonuclease subunit S [Mesomycoplasma lagogenitalium]